MGQASGVTGVFRLVTNVLIAVASITILAMMVLTGIDVLGRYIFNSPIPGSFELTEFAMAIAVFSALPIVSLSRSHISADLFSAGANGGFRKVQRLICDASGFCFFAIVSWRLWLEAGHTLSHGTTAGLLELPLAPLSYFAAVLSAVNAAVFLAHLSGMTSRGSGGGAS
jgi:TRAP-type C4-dicarboxylate transport system permease small subunit